MLNKQCVTIQSIGIIQYITSAHATVCNNISCAQYVTSVRAVRQDFHFSSFLVQCAFSSHLRTRRQVQWRPMFIKLYFYISKLYFYISVFLFVFLYFWTVFLYFWIVFYCIFQFSSLFNAHSNSFLIQSERLKFNECRNSSSQTWVDPYTDGWSLSYIFYRYILRPLSYIFIDIFWDRFHTFVISLFFETVF